MKDTDSFEELLRRQQVKAAPEIWRAGILAAAQSASGSEALSNRVVPTRGRFGLRKALLTRVGFEFLCPGRRAWGVLAAAWAVIILLTLVNRDTEVVVSAGSSNSFSPLARELLKEQTRLLVEFSGSGEASDADESRRPDVRPRSEQEAIWTRV